MIDPAWIVAGGAVLTACITTGMWLGRISSNEKAREDLNVKVTGIAEKLDELSTAWPQVREQADTTEAEVQKLREHFHDRNNRNAEIILAHAVEIERLKGDVRLLLDRGARA